MRPMAAAWILSPAPVAACFLISDFSDDVSDEVEGMTMGG